MRLGVGCARVRRSKWAEKGGDSAQVSSGEFSFLFFISISCSHFKFEISNSNLSCGFHFKYAQPKIHNGCIERYHFIIILLFHTFK
jgi:hypothetical protein